MPLGPMDVIVGVVREDAGGIANDPGFETTSSICVGGATVDEVGDAEGSEGGGPAFGGEVG